MRDLDALFNEVLEDVKAAGIKPGFIKSVKADNTLRKHAGLCTYPDEEEDGCDISIADYFLNEDVPLCNAKRILAHEIIHTAAMWQGHSPLFKRLCKQLEDSNPAYVDVAGIDRTIVTKDLFGPVLKEYRYVYECCNCGDIIADKRKTRFDGYYKRSKCQMCGGEIRKIKDAGREVIFI